MDDLISRSVLKAAFSKNSIFEKITDSRGMNVLEIIDEQPTAYDVEKVVAELEEATHRPNCFLYCGAERKCTWHEHKCGFDEMRKQAIEIVNQLAEEYSKDKDWETTRRFLDEKYFSKIRELSEKYNHPCEDIPINFVWVFGLIEKIEMQLAEEHNNDFCEWKQAGTQVGLPFFKTCKRIMPYNMNDDKKFCPYCGKKIKVVE